MSETNKTVVAWSGRLGGPVLALSVYCLPSTVTGNMPLAAQATAAAACLMAVWWMTEAIPLPATALLPLVLFPLADILTLDETAAPYANKYIFLFLGGFMIARAVEKWNLHRRIALLTVLAAGTSPTRLIGGFMLATAALSMWLSNTASTVMMLPIGMSLVVLISEKVKRDHGPDNAMAMRQNFATGMMLGIAYAASIGGLGTLVGTPTNIVLAGVADEHRISIGFGRWMLFATPFCFVFLVITWWILTRLVFPIRFKEIPGGKALIRDELAKMGRVTRGEWTVLIVFAATAAAWILRDPLLKSTWLVEHVPAAARLNDTVIAVIGALTLFLIPVDAKRGVFALDWKTASTIPWGVLLLFGGGFSLATAMSASGLALWIGDQVKGFAEFPTIALVLIIVTLVVFLTELTSNTPTAATLLPILYGVADGIGIEPMILLVPATIAASCAFMLPVATPPNAIVFGSGHVSIASMIKAGLWLNLVGIVLITFWMYTCGLWVFGGG
ncbi:MAG: DASS family sodium-coupled anion symporter [Pirellulaceae bacterium]